MEIRILKAPRFSCGDSTNAERPQKTNSSLREKVSEGDRDTVRDCPGATFRLARCCSQRALTVCTCPKRDKPESPREFWLCLLTANCGHAAASMNCFGQSGATPTVHAAPVVSVEKIRFDSRRGRHDIGMAAHEDRVALEGSGEKIFKLVSRGATPEQWVEWLRAPLEHAAAAGDLELVENLLVAGANVKEGWRGCDGRPLLCAAAHGGNHEIVSILLEAGAQPEVNISYGEKMWSALHHAASGGHETMARVLMMAGAHSAHVDLDRHSPLHLAAVGVHEHLVGDLLLNGAPPNAKNKYGETPLHIAAKRGNEHIMPALLLKGADVNALDNIGRAPIHLAARHGHLAATIALMAGGADSTLRYSDEGWSALELAACYGHLSVLRALIKHGADVNSFDDDHRTTLHNAVWYNQAGAVDILVAAGANVDARESASGWTPLHTTAKKGNCEAMLALLRNKANVNAEDAMGRRPLAVACQYLAEEATEILLRWRADETAVDSAGHPAEQLIGISVHASEWQRRSEDFERIRELLSNAPADRAWRRWFMQVLSRAFPDKAGIEREGRKAVGDAVRMDPVKSSRRMPPSPLGEATNRVFLQQNIWEAGGAGEEQGPTEDGQQPLADLTVSLSDYGSGRSGISTPFAHLRSSDGVEIDVVRREEEFVVGQILSFL